MRSSHHDESPNRRYFSGLTQDTLVAELGVADPPMVDYLSGLLWRFVRSDSVYRVRSPRGRRLDQVADMLVEAQQRVGPASREVHRHIGDFTLFWIGVYPEALPRLRASDCKDHLIDYHEHGKRAYYIASTIRDEADDEECDLLERISHQFDVCVRGLSVVRRRWEQDDLDTGGDAATPLWLS